MSQDNDYVLGTGLDELERLGLQHRIWRRVVLDGLQRWGLTSGKSIIDIGAGPGYVTMDLADIVGKTGQVYALERSDHFFDTLVKRLAHAGHDHVKVSHQDVLNDWPEMKPADFSWCRWLLCFVNNPEKVIQSLRPHLKTGGVAVFHEYIDYSTWQMFPHCPEHTAFVEHTITTWRAEGGEPDIGRQLPTILKNNGFELLEYTPYTYLVDRTDYMWQWPRSFIEVNIKHQMTSGQITEDTGNRWLQSINEAMQQDPCHFMTPTVAQVVARKI